MEDDLYAITLHLRWFLLLLLLIIIIIIINSAQALDVLPSSVRDATRGLEAGGRNHDEVM